MWGCLSGHLGRSDLRIRFRITLEYNSAFAENQTERQKVNPPFKELLQETSGPTELDDSSNKHFP